MCIQGFVLELKRPGRKVDLSPLSSTEMKNVWIHDPAPIRLHVVGRDFTSKEKDGREWVRFV
jgi:hypothetical protein